ncbi:hypothetical protein EV294_107189 [Paenibacillus sp. BK033]|uniref:hypothetical protein n=1 Tax=Paenibacillus sp. BK033 TaxID=2512133 RepID=UPI0010498DA4|nr:hypothetical protein [Paenibacillus sp. BK033]TCM93238.1 hypothetical protein EV294_107189 [Paenibacillus sp. BK033]
MADRLEGQKKPYRALIIVLCILTILIAILCYGYYQVFYAEKIILTQNSPNKINQIEIRVRGQNAFFSNAPIRIHYGKVGHIRPYIEERIINDGKNLHAENFDFNWVTEDKVSITLKGEEQEDKTLEITFPD